MATINGTAGNDTLRGTAEADMLYGLGGNDVLIFGKGPDQLFGGDGDDIVRFSNVDLVGGPFTGIANGGDGYDILDLSNIMTSNSLNLGSFPQTTAFIGPQLVLIEQFEELVLDSTGGFSSLFISGGGQFQKVSTGRGNDTLSGDGTVAVNLQGGNDRYNLFYSDEHNTPATIDGGLGNDTLAAAESFSGGTTDFGFRIDLQARAVTHHDTVTYTVLNFENVTIGEGFGSEVFGDASTNILATESGGRLGTGLGSLMDGRGGNDTISGGAFDDTLIGGTGNDYLNGSDGSDTLTGGDGNDHIFGQSVDGGDDGADSLSGGSGGDYLQGNEGDDTLNGGDAPDRIQGGRNNDIIFGGEGEDTINGNLGNDTIDGGIGNDSLRGGKDDDQIDGGDGNDTISGDKGHDVLTGGAGADLFVFAVGDAGYSGLPGSYTFDVITDFTTGADRIDIGRGFSQLSYSSESSLEDAIANAQLQAATSVNNYVVNGVGYIIYSSTHTTIDSIIQYTSTTGLLSLNISDLVFG